MNVDLCQMLLQLMGDSKTKEREILRKYIKNEKLTEKEENVSFGIYSIEQTIKALEKMKEKEMEKQQEKIEAFLKEKDISPFFFQSFEEAWKNGTKKGIKQTIESLLEVEKFQHQEMLKNMVEDERDLNKLEHWNHHMIWITAEVRNKEKKPVMYPHRNKSLTASEKEERLMGYIKDIGEDEFIELLTFMKRKKEND